MKREIKFRAWDTKEKKMLDSNSDGTCKVRADVYDVAFLMLGLNGEVIKYERERTRGATFFDAGVQGQHEIDGTGERFVLMQYTGLKDKNGKEVYEGDIVMILDKKASVYYENGGFRTDALFKSSFIYLSENNVKIEIIGNMYENPNLLTNI
jgi:hypothetical protein